MSMQEIAERAIETACKETLEEAGGTSGDIDPLLALKLEKTAAELASILGAWTRALTTAAERPQFEAFVAPTAWDFEVNFKKLQQIDQEARDAGRLLGRYIDSSVADGYAYYQIVEDLGAFVKIRHVTGFGDDYSVMQWGAEALIPRDMAAGIVAHRDTYDKIIAEQRKEKFDEA